MRSEQEEEGGEGVTFMIAAIEDNSLWAIGDQHGQQETYNLHTILPTINKVSIEDIDVRGIRETRLV